MRKLIGYIPATLFTAVYLFAWFSGNGLTLSMVLIWLACFWLSAFVLHKGLCWGGIFGMIPGVQMIYMGAQETGQVINIEMPLGIMLILFYGIFGVYLWKKRKDISKTEYKEIAIIFIKSVLTIAVVIVSGYAAIISAMFLASKGINPVLSTIGAFVIPSLLLPLIWLKKRKNFYLFG